MDLKEKVTRIVRDEFGDCVEEIRFSGPYEAEDFHVTVNLNSEPEDISERKDRLYLRVWELGHDITVVVDWPDDELAQARDRNAHLQVST